MRQFKNYQKIFKKWVDKLGIGCYYKFNNKTTETKNKRSKEPVLKGNSSSESKIYHIDGMNETDGDHKDQGGTVQCTVKDRTKYM